jgi:hypothetical protein
MAHQAADRRQDKSVRQAGPNKLSASKDRAGMHVGRQAGHSCIQA